MKKICLDLFAGTRSSTQAFADHPDWIVKTVEKDTDHEGIDLYADILQVTAEDLLALCGRKPDFIWASPPCTGFSVASIGRHWRLVNGVHQPQTPTAQLGIELVEHTLKLIRELQPEHWVMENPRGILRKLPVVKYIPRVTVTYCQYGDSRMKPTDLWGNLPDGFTPRACKNGDSCHTPAPRGSTTGTQGLKGAKNRSRIPYALGQSLVDALSQVPTP